MDKILEGLKLKKLDNFLLLNYPSFWLKKIHYFLTLSIAGTLIIALYYIFNNSILNIHMLEGLFISIFIIFFYFNKKFQRIKINALKEYFLYLTVIILILIPFILSFYLSNKNVQQYIPIYNNSYAFNSFKLKDNKIYLKHEGNKIKEKIFIDNLLKSFIHKKNFKISRLDYNKIKYNYAELSIFIFLKKNIEKILILILTLPIIILYNLYAKKNIFIIHMYIPLIYILYELNISDDIVSFKEKFFILTEYFKGIDIYMAISIFVVANFFIYGYKIKNNYHLVTIIIYGFFLYFLIFYFFLNLTIFESGFLIVLNILIIITSIKEKLMFLNAQPTE